MKFQLLAIFALVVVVAAQDPLGLADAGNGLTTVDPNTTIDLNALANAGNGNPPATVDPNALANAGNTGNPPATVDPNALANAGNTGNSPATVDPLVLAQAAAAAAAAEEQATLAKIANVKSCVANGIKLNSRAVAQQASGSDADFLNAFTEAARTCLLPQVPSFGGNLREAVQSGVSAVVKLLHPNLISLFGSLSASEKVAKAAQSGLLVAENLFPLTATSDVRVFEAGVSAALFPLAAVVQAAGFSVNSLSSQFSAIILAWASPTPVATPAEACDDLVQQIAFLFQKAVSSQDLTSAEQAALSSLVQEATNFRLTHIAIPPQPIVDSSALQNLFASSNVPVNSTVLEAAVNGINFYLTPSKPNSVTFVSFAAAQNFAINWQDAGRPGPPSDVLNTNGYAISQSGATITWVATNSGSTAAPSTNIGAAALSPLGVALVAVGIVCIVVALALFSHHFKSTRQQRRVYSRGTMSSSASGSSTKQLIQVRPTTPWEL